MNAPLLPSSERLTPPIIQVSGTHRDIGLQIGARFQEEIKEGLLSHGGLQTKFLPFHSTEDGQNIYQELLRINKQAFPDYVEELEGIAEGAGVSFEELFIINLRGEYRGYIDDASDPGCSTCVLKNDDEMLFIHNEDGLESFRDKMYFVEAAPIGKPSFTALSYPGFLIGNSFGFNEHGICFSVDNVRPTDAQAGLARHFLCRSLFEAHSIDDAIERVTQEGRAAGFHYTIASLNEQRIVTVETAPHAVSVRESEGVYFHANHYIELAHQGQRLMPSTLHRLERAKEVLAESESLSRKDVLSLLGDTADSDYPIFRNGKGPDGCVTLCTTVFDLQAAKMRVIFGHPDDAAAAVVDCDLS